MKKLKIFSVAILCLFMLGSVAVMAAENWKVSVSSQKFIVNGKSVKVNALNINDSNYIKVAEFAELLDIDISFDGNTGTVSFDKSKPFTGIRNENNEDSKVNSNGGSQVNSSSGGSQINGESRAIDIDIPSLKGFVKHGPYDIKTGDRIKYDIKGEGKAMFLSASFSAEKDWMPEQIGTNQVAADHELYRTATYTGNVFRGEFTATVDGTYYLYILNLGDTILENVKGTVTIGK